MVSRLYELWEATKHRKLNDTELREADYYIVNPTYSLENCIECSQSKPEKALYGVQFCQKHMKEIFDASRK